MMLLDNPSMIVTPRASGTTKRGHPVARGTAMGRLDVRRGESIAINGDRIAAIGPTDALRAELANAERIDCTGRTILPGFVDSHTHLVFAGNRADEFAMRLRGATYQEIYESGGGIRSSMRAVRAASLEEIVERVRPLIRSAFAHGSTTIEVKSGYGLDTESELKLLEAIKVLDAEESPTLIATFLGAHAFPPEFANDREGYIRRIIEEMIPEVASRELARFCDVFTDEGYFTIDESERILSAARDHGLALRVHADELADVDAAAMAVRLDCHSADHLLRISEANIAALAASDTIATLLPGTAFYLNLPYAPARALIAADCAVALATDCNPGTNMCESMGMTLALACMGMRMTIEEAITAATLNGAAALGMSDTVGMIAPGMVADLLICDVSGYAELVYHYGVNHVERVVKGGELS